MIDHQASIPSLPPILHTAVPLQDLLVLHRAATARHPQHQLEWDAWLLHTAEPLVATQQPWRHTAPSAVPTITQCILRCTGTTTAPQRAQLDALRLATTLLHAHKTMLDAAARAQLLVAASRMARPHPGQQGFTEQQVQALTVMHAAAMHIGSGGVRNPALDGAATVLASLLDWCVGFRRRPLEQRPWSRLYVALLRACAAVFAEVRDEEMNCISIARDTQLKGLPEDVSLPCVTPCLCTFFTYGSHVPSPAPTTDAPTRRYVPPHRRGSDSSDSMSDSDGGAHDPLRSSRVRSAALQALQALVRCDPLGVHGMWPVCLPPEGPGGVLQCLHDSEPRVRSVAANVLMTLLDGPQQRSCIAMASLPDTKSISVRYVVFPCSSMRSMHCRGFTTLSEALGRTLLTLHTELLRYLATEHVPSVLPPMLRALTALVHATPYQRMQPGLLLRVVEVRAAHAGENDIPRVAPNRVYGHGCSPPLQKA